MKPGAATGPAARIPPSASLLVPTGAADAPAVVRVFGWRRAALIASYLALYLLFDWASAIHPLLGLNITPWNPTPGLSLALLFVFGLRYAPMLFVAGLLSETVIRGLVAPPPIVIAANLAPVFGYAAVAWVMQRRLGFDYRLGTVRDLALLAGAAVIAAAIVSVLVIGTYAVLGALTPAQYAPAILRYWIGDAIGIAVTAPVLLRFPRRAASGVRLGEIAAQTLVLLACLWFVTTLPPPEQFKYFYVLFLPAVWIAVRHGLTGAAMACFVIQVVLMADAVRDGTTAFEVIELQALMMTLAVTTLFTGVLVDERRRQEAAREKLRDEMSHLARLSVGGEIATGLAHELNQPLTAMLNYLRVGKAQIDRGGSTGEILDPLAKAEAQGIRAAETIRRLREFLRHGSLSVVPFMLGEAASEAVALVRVASRTSDIAVRVAPELQGMAVRGDRIHTTQVLVNLVTNAYEALAEAGTDHGQIEITAARSGREIVIAVADNGPGVPAADRDHIFNSFFSTKSEGMGLGLAISRTLVEAQNGRIWYEPGASGRHRFLFTIPLEGS